MLGIRDGTLAVVLLLGVTGSACGGAEPNADISPIPTMEPPSVVTADPAAAAAVPIDGATPEEEALARAVLASLGHDSGVARIAFGDGDGGRRFDIRATEPFDVRSSLGQERRWLATEAGAAIAGALSSNGAAVPWTLDGTSPPIGVADAGPPVDVASLAATIAANAVEAGVNADVRAYSVGPGLVSLKMRLDDEQILTGGGDIYERLVLSTSHQGERLHRLLLVTAPDGTAMEAGGWWGSGGWGFFGARGDAPGSAGPIADADDTLLRVTVRSTDGTGAAKESAPVTLDCGGDGSSGFIDPAVVCAQLMRDRYLLLPPLQSTCGGGVDGAPSVRIDGRLAGRQVERVYDGCSSGVVSRWLRLVETDGAA